MFFSRNDVPGNDVPLKSIRGNGNPFRIGLHHCPSSVRCSCGRGRGRFEHARRRSHRRSTRGGQGVAGSGGSGPESQVPRSTGTGHVTSARGACRAGWGRTSAA